MLEIKTRGPGYTTKQANLYWSYPPNSGTIPVTVLSDYKLLYTELASIPHFHRLKKSGALLPHLPFQQLDISRCTHDANYSKVKNLSGGQQERAWGSAWVGELPQSGNIPTTAELLAHCNGKNPEQLIANALATLYARNWDGLTFLAEARKTVSMFRNAIPKVIDLTRKLLSHPNKRVGILSNLEMIKNHAPDLYLEFRYGWRTLYFDMLSISKAIEGMKEADREFYTSRSGSNFSINSTKATTFGVANEYTATYNRVLTGNMSIRGNVTSKIRPSTVISSLPITLWEITPFSLIIDWFLGVGTSIAALSGELMIAEYSSSWGARIEGSVSGSTSNLVRTSSRWDSISVTANLRCDYEYVIRVPASPSFIPRLQFNLDGFKVLDLILILRQVLRR